MTYEEARDYMFSVLTDAWNPRPILWEDIRGDIPLEQVPWCRPNLQHVDGGAGSIGGQTGCRRYTRAGNLIVQVFSPIGQGQTEAYQLAQLVSDAYEDAKGPVWFRNVRIREVGQDGDFQQVNVISDFEYETVR